MSIHQRLTVGIFDQADSGGFADNHQFHQGQRYFPDHFGRLPVHKALSGKRILIGRFLSISFAAFL